MADLLLFLSAPTALAPMEISTPAKPGANRLSAGLSAQGSAEVCLRSLGPMICTFCGSENRAENRFCGMCGVRLERRTTERRANQMGSLKCPSCSHVNDPGYRFCSMCGSRIERRVLDRRGADDQSRGTALANGPLPQPEASRQKSAPPTGPEPPPV